MSAKFSKGLKQGQKLEQIVYDLLSKMVYLEDLYDRPEAVGHYVTLERVELAEGLTEFDKDYYAKNQFDICIQIKGWWFPVEVKESKKQSYSAFEGFNRIIVDSARVYKAKQQKPLFYVVVPKGWDRKDLKKVFFVIPELDEQNFFEEECWGHELKLWVRCKEGAIPQHFSLSRLTEYLQTKVESLHTKDPIDRKERMRQKFKNKTDVDRKIDSFLTEQAFLQGKVVDLGFFSNNKCDFNGNPVRQREECLCFLKQRVQRLGTALGKLELGHSNTKKTARKK